MTTNVQRAVQQRDPKAVVARAQQVMGAIMGQVRQVIVGKEHVLEYLSAGMITEGCHILFEDMPGLAKSVMASASARALGCDFRRIQFTPDLLPGDITGTYIYDQDRREFSLRPGPIFSNILLADEINRASPKTQSALLEAMAEKQVSIEGSTHRLPTPFIVLATQNPVEQEGTYPLPEAQLDRFMLKLSMGYPSRLEEREIILRRARRGKDAFDVKAIATPEMISEITSSMEQIHVAVPIVDYIAELVDRTRTHPQVVAGSSPRGGLALFKLARSWAALHGRGFVTPEDVKALAVPVLAHRIILRPEARIHGTTGKDVVEQILKEASVPKFTVAAE